MSCLRIGFHRRDHGSTCPIASTLGWEDLTRSMVLSFGFGLQPEVNT